MNWSQQLCWCSMSIQSFVRILSYHSSYLGEVILLVSGVIVNVCGWKLALEASPSLGNMEHDILSIRFNILDCCVKEWLKICSAQKKILKQKKKIQGVWKTILGKMQLDQEVLVPKLALRSSLKYSPGSWNICG